MTAVAARAPFRLAAVVVLAMLLLRCGGTSRETVTVTQRPEPIPSTEDSGAVVAAQPLVPVPSGYDTVQAQRFDQGKMWTFDHPPVDYFEAEYGFRPRDAWFSRARLGALRFGDGCSASFVSPSGLVMTNHHCARDAITSVEDEGEALLDNGFYADSLAAEREAESLHVDQLIRIEEVTEDVYAALPENPSAEARQQRVSQLEEQLSSDAKRKNDRLLVEVVPLYNGAQYSAYTYRRYDDVRLVMAPELQMGFYGGSADNFTYPRYALDVTFFRVYDADDTPLETSDYFSWSTDGVEAGDPVFVVGNPGSTSRLSTVSQLKHRRDHALPNQLDVLRTRASLLETYVAAHADSSAAYDLRNSYFSIENSVKNYDGQLRGLRDPYLIARRAKAERALLDSIAAVDSLGTTPATLINKIQQIQQSKRVIASKDGAFTAFGSVRIGSRVLTRGVYAYFYDFLRTRGAPADRLNSLREEAAKVTDWPAEVEQAFIAARLTEVREAYGRRHPTMQKLFRTRSPDDWARRLVQESALMDSAAYDTLLADGYLSSRDPSVPVMQAITPLFRNVREQMQGFADTEETLNAQLSRARFAIHGHRVPPDATFTLRLADGVVKPYEYNGTRAPAFTNFFGLYDHYYSYNAGAWALPETWVRQPDSLDLETPLNLVSTNDITGGNSGSPLLNRNLEVVGVVFDSNIEALPNEFLYRDEAARAVSVDARGILEALRDVYDADRLAHELTTGTALSTDAEAERASSSTSGVR